MGRWMEKTGVVLLTFLVLLSVVLTSSNSPKETAEEWDIQGVTFATEYSVDGIHWNPLEAGLPRDVSWISVRGLLKESIPQEKRLLFQLQNTDVALWGRESLLFQYQSDPVLREIGRAHV